MRVCGEEIADSKVVKKILHYVNKICSYSNYNKRVQWYEYNENCKAIENRKLCEHNFGEDRKINKINLEESNDKQ